MCLKQAKEEEVPEVVKPVKDEYTSEWTSADVTQAVAPEVSDVSVNAGFNHDILLRPKEKNTVVSGNVAKKIWVGRCFFYRSILQSVSTQC